MYNISRSALVPYSDQKMFDLINDVDDYENFLPWCGGSKVLEDDKGRRVASVTIAFKGVHKTFTTQNTLDPYKQIKLEMVDGPFSKLSGSWRLKRWTRMPARLVSILTLIFQINWWARLLGRYLK